MIRAQPERYVYVALPQEVGLMTILAIETVGSQFWGTLRQEATQIEQQEPLLATYVRECILNHANYSSALCFILSTKLADAVLPRDTLCELISGVYQHNPEITCFAIHDLKAVFNRDPAIHSYTSVLLNLKGFQALQIHRIAHVLWQTDRRDLALLIQSRNSEVFGVDIHPACKIGKGVMFDHATGIVIGETAIVEDNVSIMQSVTLGGTGNEIGERHPKVRSGVLIGAGAKVLGNIEVGENSKVGAGSVVLKPVAPNTTVAGVPAQRVGMPKCRKPCESLEQNVLEDKDNRQLSRV